MTEISSDYTLNKIETITNNIEEAMKRKFEEIEENKTEENKEENKEEIKEENKTEENKTEENKTEENKTEENKTEENKEETEKKKNEILKNKVLSLKKESDTQPVQRTAEWFELRKTRITASDVASCLRKTSTVCKHYMQEYGLQKSFKHSENNFCNPYSSETEFILKKKGYIKYESNSAVNWGNKYEDAVVCFYERNFNEQVLSFGLLLHPTISWLACSPDGITFSAKMIEIKCPFRRKLTGVPPIYYWIQCQIQLEVCDLEECDYIECDLENLTREQWEKIPDNIVSVSHDKKTGMKRENKQLKCKGILINIDKNYYYPPLKYKTYPEMIRWAEKKAKKYKDLNPEIEYYRIKEYCLVNIKRNRDWFNCAKPLLERTWKKVLNFDIKNYNHYFETQKKEENNKILDFRTDKNDVCLLSDDEN